MSEWATRMNVARWTKQLAKIKAQGIAEPLLTAPPVE
jgi:hypothetical protein